MTEASREVRSEGTRSAAVGVNHGVVSLGDNAHNVVVTLPQAGLPDAGGTPAPQGTSRLRGGPGAGVFVGREAQLGALSATDGGARVLVGLGGSGKTAIACVFARERRAHDNPVWWIEAHSKERIEAGLAQLAVRLAPIFAGLPVPVAASWTRSWLAAHRGWLLVFDDVESPDDVRDLIDELPDGGFLLTSRQGTGWQGLARIVPVGDLSRQEATRLLELVMREGSAGEPALSGADRLCERLGWLPLAIEQAGAFIAQNVSTPAEYLEMLESGGAQVLGLGAHGLDPKRTVTRIWQVTFDRLAEDPLAAEMLRVLAWFAPTGIPRTLETSAPEPGLRAALNLLAAYHLVTLTKDAISVHPLVQEIARTTSQEDPHRTAEQIERARTAAAALLLSAAAATGSGSQSPESWPAQRRLFPHIEALAAHTPPEQDDEQTAVLLGWLGQCKDVHGEYRGAISYLTRSLEGHGRLLDTVPEAKLRFAIYRLALASAYRHAGQAERSLRLLEQTVVFATEALGATRDTTLTARAALGAAYAESGEHQRAVAELRTLLELTTAEYGENDPQTRLARNNLAGAMTLAGLVEEAVRIYERSYEADLANLGPDHPSTLVTGHNLAFTRQEAGRLEAAMELFERIAERRADVLGRKHPDTLITLSNLAVTKLLARDFAGARSLTERVLADREEVLGPDHPATRDLREGLASLVELTAAEAGQETKQTPAIDPPEAREPRPTASAIAASSEVGKRSRSLSRLFRRD